jgi:hypothetical protein
MFIDIRYRHIDMDIHIYIYIYTVKAAVSVYIYTYIRKAGFAGNGKRKRVFLGRQTINGNRRLLFELRWPLMWKYFLAIACTQLLEA